LYVELTTSGKSWGRGPVQSDIHGSNMRTVDNPAWRHIQMLASLTTPDGNTPLIKGFFDNKEPPTADDVAKMKAAAAKLDLTVAARRLGVARYKWDDPYMVLKGASFETSFNLDGIWGGNMYAGGAGAILPNKVTSKHNFRYVPRMMGMDILKKLRAQIDANGYKDVEVKLIGDVPWSRGSSRDTDITRAGEKATEHLGSLGLGGGSADPGRPRYTPDAPPTPGQGAPRISAANANGMASDLETEPTGGYWPSYLWTDGEVGEKVGTIRIPMGMGGSGGGGRNHAANEYYTIEAIGKNGGMANAEKAVAAAIFEYSRITTVPPRPKTPTARR
ncbi:MAG: peptidase dimerization domain-containing protein, partial [Acidobacteria bacterium]|nr:peptidase dimerization domain-containing protein [Acidobacteriota bacterium]